MEYNDVNFLKRWKANPNEENGPSTSNANAATRSFLPPSTSTTNEVERFRGPKCTRCRNHDITVSIREHEGVCPFRNCVCETCIHIAERQRVMAERQRVLALQVALRRAQEQDISLNLRSRIQERVGRRRG